jgi:hypothetical protein
MKADDLLLHLEAYIYSVGERVRIFSSRAGETAAQFRGIRPRQRQYGTDHRPNRS